MGDLRATIAQAFRRVLLPLAAYYAVTVAIPLANGAAQSGPTFWQHMLAVLGVPLVIVVLVCIACVIGRLLPPPVTRAHTKSTTKDTMVTKAITL